MKRKLPSPSSLAMRCNQGILFVSYLLLSVLYCASIMSFISITSDQVVPFVQILVVSLFCMLYAYAFLKSTTSMIITCSISIVFLVVYILAGRKPELFAWLFTWNWRNFEQRYYAVMSFLPLTLIWSIYITIFTKKMFHFFALILPGLLLFVVQLSTGQTAPVAFYTCLASILIFTVMRPALECREKSFLFGHSQDARSRKRMLASVSFSLIAILFSTWITTPLPPDPAHSMLDWFGISLSPSTRNPNYSHWSHPGRTSNRTQLGGNMVLNDQEVFTLSSQSETLFPQHLAATRKGVYNNNQWSSNARFTYYDPSSDYNLLETRARQLALGSSFQNIDVQMLQLKTLQSSSATLFHPLMTTSFSLLPEMQMEANPLGDKILVPPLRKEEGYQFSVLSLSERELQYMDQNFIAGHELNWNQYQILNSETGPQNADHHDYLQWIQMSFRNLPESITPRTIELAKELTEGIDSTYEQARTLELYLKQIPYTLTPGPVPAGQDIVDYFLFDHREGYCTYYATALCIMARAIGLPSRYVEGFLVDGSATGSVTVTNASAHAWTEIHFPHMGWVTFDPTGADPNAGNDHDDAPDDVTSHETPVGGDHLQDASTWFASLLSNNVLSWMLLALVSIMLLLLCLVLALFLRNGLRTRTLHRLAHADDRTFSHGYFRELVRLIGVVDADPFFQQRPHETVLQFLERIQPQFSSLDLNEVTQILQQGIYSDQPLSQEQRHLVLHTQEQLHQLARNRLGKLQYFFRTARSPAGYRHA